MAEGEQHPEAQAHDHANGVDGAAAPVDEQVVTPWDVAGGADGKIDYNKLVEQFGCQAIDEALVQRIERLTGRPAHPFLKRGVFFAHRCARRRRLRSPLAAPPHPHSGSPPPHAPSEKIRNYPQEPSTAGTASRTPDILVEICVVS
jgi:hypothetical protein